MPKAAVPSLLHRMLLHVEVQRYVQGVVTYVLSRQWKDLFAIYALRLQPLPYCSNVIVERIPCTAPATLGIQALFVVSLLVGAAVIARISAHYEHFWPRLRTVPAMAGMCVGWSFGDLSIQLLVELAGGIASNFALATVETLLSAAILAAALYAAESANQAQSGAAGGGGGAARRLLPLLHVMRAATWPLVSHALGVGVMVTWAHSLKSLLQFKLDVDPLHGLDGVGYEAGEYSSRTPQHGAPAFPHASLSARTQPAEPPPLPGLRRNPAPAPRPQACSINGCSCSGASRAPPCRLCW